MKQLLRLIVLLLILTTSQIAFSGNGKLSCNSATNKSTVFANDNHEKHSLLKPHLTYHFSATTLRYSSPAIFGPTFFGFRNLLVITKTESVVNFKTIYGSQSITLSMLLYLYHFFW